ncbi:acyl-CoA dehydrogenase family protein [Mumia sp. DW29H23]|uniref:acyl-CoA dehydrogenase family protein n=1 Tax=Mumia sp. DW29H23 TaxID=3421241 RepID=UPI003D697A0A
MSRMADLAQVEDQDHRDFRRSLRAYLEQRLPVSRVRELVVDGEDVGDATQRRALWRHLCGELGVAGLCVPEQYGGQGAPSTYEAVVMEELGRSLAPLPMISTAVLTVAALLAADDEDACRRWLPPIARGDLVATVAAAERPHDWDLQAIETTAVWNGAQWRITGTKPWVVDGDCADVVLVLAGTEDGPGLLAVDLTDETVRREAGATLDPTRPVAVLRFVDAPAELVGALGRGRDILDASFRRAAVALGAEQLGVAARALEMAVDHATQRVQFGRPIGSFQAIKHLLADRYVEIEGLRASVRHAARALDDDPEQVPLLAHLCQAVGSEAALEAAGATIQVHGGIGFTWDHDAHLYFKRATVSRQWFGTPEHHRDKVAALMLGATA